MFIFELQILQNGDENRDDFNLKNSQNVDNISSMNFVQQKESKRLIEPFLRTDKKGKW